MTHRKDFECVDDLLRLLENSIAIFGGKVFVCAGDFRQIPPVVKNGNRIDTVAASLKTCVRFL